MNLSITTEKWTSAVIELGTYGELVKDYIVGLGDVNNGPFGTAVLCVNESKEGFLTASHIARSIKDELIFIVHFDGNRHFYSPINNSKFLSKEWDCNFNNQMLNNHPGLLCPKDLAFVHLSSEVVDSLKTDGKRFYVPAQYCQHSIIESFRLFAMGTHKPYFDGRDWCSTIGPFGLVGKQYFARYIDYLDATIQNDTYGIRYLGEEPAASFWGLSGGPVFHLLEDNSPCLCGIVISEDMSKTSGGHLYAHGPKSIKSFFEYLKNM